MYFPHSQHLSFSYTGLLLTRANMFTCVHTNVAEIISICISYDSFLFIKALQECDRRVCISSFILRASRVMGRGERVTGNLGQTTE